MASDDPSDRPRSLLDPPLRFPERQSPSQAAGGADDLDPEIPPLPTSLMAARLHRDEKSGGRSVVQRGRKALPAAVAVLVVGGFAAAVWWTYQSVQPPENEADVPLITAQTEPEKVVPEDEGGLEVPFQDETIYEQVPPGSTEQTGEQLLQPPETPTAPPPEEPEMATVAPTPEEPPEPAALDSDASTPTVPSDPAVEAPAVPSVAAPEPVAPTEEAPADALDVPEVEQTPVPWVGPFKVPPQKPAVPDMPAVAAVIVSTSDELAATAASDSELTTVGALPLAPATPEVAPAEAVAAAPALDPMSGARVQLASLRDEAGARAEWLRVLRKFPDLLGQLQPVFVRAAFGDGSTYYRLQAGPLADRAAAVNLCLSLKQRQQDCLVALQ